MGRGLLLAAVVAAACWFQSSQLALPLNWDEADYVHAAEKGILANALERGSLTAWQFVDLGLRKARGQPVESLLLPEEAEDPFLLRHFHPPGPIYLWTLGRTERALRMLNIALLAALAGTFLLALRVAGPSNPGGGAVPFALPALLTSAIVQDGFRRLTFHTFHAVAAVAFLGALAVFLENPSRRRAAVAGLAGAGLLLTLETAWFILAGVAVTAVVAGMRRRLQAHAGAFAATLGLATLLSWPGLLVTAAPAKTWFTYLYRMTFAGNEEYRDVSVPAALAQAAAANLLPCATIVLGGVATFTLSRRGVLPRHLIVLWGSSLALLITMLPFSLRPDYLLPAITMLTFVAVLSIDHWLAGRAERTQRWFSAAAPAAGIAILAGFLLLSDRSGAAADAAAERADWLDDVEVIRGYLAPDRQLIMDGGHILRRYLAEEERGGVVDLHLRQGDRPFWRREHHAYRDLGQAVDEHTWSAVIIRRERDTSRAAELLGASGYRRHALKKHWLFAPPPGD